MEQKTSELSEIIRKSNELAIRTSVISNSVDRGLEFKNIKQIEIMSNQRKIIILTGMHTGSN